MSLSWYVQIGPLQSGVCNYIALEKIYGMLILQIGTFSQRTPLAMPLITGAKLFYANHNPNPAVKINSNEKAANKKSQKIYPDIFNNQAVRHVLHEGF